MRLSAPASERPAISLDRMDVAKPRSLIRDAWGRFAQNRMALAGLTVVVIYLALSIAGPWISPYDYRRQDLLHASEGPSWAHWFGTDGLGRDYLTRVMMGGRTAFVVATVVVGLSSALGLLIGTSAGWIGGAFDNAVMRLADTVMSFPHLLLAVFLVGTVRPPVVRQLTSLGVGRDSIVVDYVLIFGALALVGWAGEARLVRGQVLSLRRSEFIVAAKALGATDRRIVLRHLAPNAIGPLIVSASSAYGGAMLLESSLSFLGVGVRPPGASWGAMISENLVTWRYDPHLLAIPGVVLAVAVLAFNAVGDGINDALNPRR